MPNATWDTISGGVRIAAKTKTPRMTNFRLEVNIFALVQPMRVVRYSATGSRNAIPKGTINPKRKFTNIL